MCAGNVTTPEGFAYLVQRSWSNRAAAAGLDPCLPAPASPYFATTPIVADPISFDSVDLGGTVATQGVKLANGESKVVDLKLWSSAPTGEWTIQALDKTELFGGPPSLSLVLDKSAGRNGDTLHLKITARNVGDGGAAFWIVSKLGADSVLSGGMVAR